MYNGKAWRYVLYPKEEKVAMPFLYHNITTVGLQLIKDGIFRARRCTPERFKHLSKHDWLLDASHRLDEDKTLYAVFFWSNESSAKREAGETSGIVTLRFPYENEIVQHYSQSYDLYYPEGESYVFWGIEQSKAKYSKVGVKLSKVDVAHRQVWIPYPAFEQAHLINGHSAHNSEYV